MTRTLYILGPRGRPSLIRIKPGLAAMLTRRKSAYEAVVLLARRN